MKDNGALRDRFRGALLGATLGDALGAPFEGAMHVDAAKLEEVLASRRGFLWYTDDGHLTMATAQSLIFCGGELDADHMAKTLAEYHAREPHRGYGAGAVRLFAELRRGRRWEDASAALFGGQGSFGNGGAMRIAPAALIRYRDPKDAASFAREVARITHAHPVGQDGAAVLAAAQARAVLTGKQCDFAPTLVAELTPIAQTRELSQALDTLDTLDKAACVKDVVSALGHGVEAHRSVPAAIYAVLRHPESFAEVVRFAISLGGDTDTVASMAAALSGGYLGASAIEPGWRKRLERAETFERMADSLYELAAGRGVS